MKKALSEMTLEELWQLFPIYLTEHKDHWEAWYNEEVKILQSLLPYDIRFHTHFCRYAKRNQTDC